MSGLSKSLITTAGIPGATKGDRTGGRRKLSLEIARRLRAAQSDDEAAEALEAVIELARTPED